MGELYNRRPAFVKSSFPEFDTYVHDLYKKKLLKPGSSGRYKLASLGDKALRKHLMDAGPFKLFLLSRLVPEFGINYRIRMLEGFIGSSLILCACMILALLFEKTIKDNFFLQIIFSIAVLLFLGFFFVTGVAIICNFLFSLAMTISDSLIRVLRKYILGGFIAIVVLLLVLIVMLVTTYTDYSIGQVIGGLVISALGGSLYFLKSIKDIYEKKVRPE